MNECGEQGDDLPSIGDVAYYISLIKEGNPDTEGSRALLRLFCHRAKQLRFPEAPFPEPLLVFLVDVFERYLSGKEKDLEKALGLKRRGRPPDPEILKRNHFIAADVCRLEMGGKSLTGSRADLDGAFVEVAEKHGLSESEVRDIYYKHQNSGLAIILWRDCWKTILPNPDD